MKSFHVWKYKIFNKNYPGYQLSCDPSFVLEILAFIKSPYKFKKRIRFEATKPPESIHNFRSIKYFLSFEIFISQNSKVKWSITENSDLIILAFNETESEEISNYLNEYLNGLNDFSFGGDPELWVW